MGHGLWFQLDPHTSVALGCPNWTRSFGLYCLWPHKHWGHCLWLNHTCSTRNWSRSGRNDSTTSSSDALSLHGLHCFRPNTCRNQLEKNGGISASYERPTQKHNGCDCVTWCILPPLVWSWFGPVPCDGVAPECLIQPGLWGCSHPHRFLSKSQFMRQTKEKQKHRGCS